MSEMIERLGLVVRRSHAWQACEEMDAEQLVREILAEMRTPTEAMVYPLGDLGLRSRRHAEFVWRKMIDEALR